MDDRCGERIAAGIALCLTFSSDGDMVSHKYLDCV